MQSTERVRQARDHAARYARDGLLRLLAVETGVNYWTLRKFLHDPDRELRASSVDAILAHRDQAATDLPAADIPAR